MLFYPSEGAFFVSSPTAIIKGAKSPNAARLFAQFMISPAAQNLIATSGIHASRPDVPPPPGLPALSGIKALPIDLDYVEEQNRDVRRGSTRYFSRMAWLPGRRAGPAPATRA